MQEGRGRKVVSPKRASPVSAVLQGQLVAADPEEPTDTLQTLKPDARVWPPKWPVVRCRRLRRMKGFEPPRLASYQVLPRVGRGDEI